MEEPPKDYTILWVGLLIVTIMAMVTFCIVCHRKRKRRRRRRRGGLHRPLQLPVPSAAGSSTSLKRVPPPPQHVCEELGERFASVDSV